MNKDRIEELRSLLEQYEYEYYILNSPTIGDVEYDMLMKELEELERENPQYITPSSPTQRVGSDLSGGDRSVKHLRPMLSLSNTYTTQEVLEFCERVDRLAGRHLALSAELKYDGVSISLIYTHGTLTRAVTRGDGVQGDDVTSAVRAIRSIPLKLRGAEVLPAELEVRGEILLPWREFERLNREREEEGLSPFANPRNAVAGTIKQLSPSVVAQRRPDAYFYYLLSREESELPASHFERLSLMRKMGLKVSPHVHLCSTHEELLEFISEWSHKREDLEVATDGIVVKVDDRSVYDMIGLTAKSPKWAMAFKYPAQEATTRVVGVDFQVGRTGVVTPVANLEGVQLSGTVVRRASLHNGDIISRLDLHYGDFVVVEKGGEIIPKISRVRYDLRDDRVEAKVQMPEFCPACSTPLCRVQGEVAMYCPNEENCPPQIIGRIEHFTSRKAMNILIGPETIEALYERGMVRDVSDLYRLRAEDFLTLPLFKEKSARNLYQSIQGSLSVPFDRVLYALGIKYVGEGMARLLAHTYGNIHTLQQASLLELQTIEGVGEITARSLIEYFSKSEHQDLLDRLIASGLQFELTPPSSQGDLLLGETIVVSGTFHKIEREALKELILRQGGKVATSISSKTTMMLVGDKVGPSKLQKAEKLGTHIISEEVFFETYPSLLEE